MREFVKDYLVSQGAVAFNEEAFEDVFYIFDRDRSGTVERSEMREFVRELLGWKPRSK